MMKTYQNLVKFEIWRRGEEVSKVYDLKQCNNCLQKGLQPFETALFLIKHYKSQL